MRTTKFFRINVSVLLFVFMLANTLLPFEAVKAEYAAPEAISYEPDLVLPPTPTSTNTPMPTAHMDYDINIYVNPDVKSSNPDIRKGFEVYCNSGSRITDADGRCRFLVYPGKSYTATITKENYLKRSINAYPAPIGGSGHMVTVWAGDVNQDDAINMVDITKVAGSFNSLKGDSRYNENYDFDMNDTINILDIIIVAKHFNTTSESYNDIELS